MKSSTTFCNWNKSMANLREGIYFLSSEFTPLKGLFKRRRMMIHCDPELHTLEEKDLVSQIKWKCSWWLSSPSDLLLGPVWGAREGGWASRGHVAKGKTAHCPRRVQRTHPRTWFVLEGSSLRRCWVFHFLYLWVTYPSQEISILWIFFFKQSCGSPAKQYQ